MEEILILLDGVDTKLRAEIAKITKSPHQPAIMEGNLKLLLEARSLVQEAINKLLSQRLVEV